MFPSRAAAWLALLALAFGVQRLRTYDEPFERDIMTYAVIGHELVLGNRLYSDVLDNKPPAIYATFGLAELLVGYGPGAVYLVNVVFGILALAGLYLAAARAEGTSAGLLAALLWLVFSYDLALQANQPNTELCLNALLSLAFALAFPAGPLARSFGAGALLALASLYKPVALVVGPCWAMAVFFLAWRDGTLRRAWTQVAALGIPSALVWAATLAYFWLDDRLDLFITVMFEFNRDYAGELGGNLTRALSPARLWPGALAAAVPLLLLSLVGVALGRAKSAERWLPIAAWFAGAVAMVALPGHWWDHYYQLYLPPLVLGATAGVAEAGRLRAPWGSWTRVVLLTVTFAVGLRGLLSQLILDGDAASRLKYGDRFLAVREAARQASALLREGETLYMYGIDAGVYFHTRRRPIAQALWINHLTGPLRVPLRHALRRQLREVRPDLMVIDTRYHLDRLPPGLVLWMEEEYQRLPAGREMEPFQLAVRRDSPLRARLAAGTR
jgi:4-amino-4-deoxy-L-arabinose transferase-like glycosyltransferase